ncbi:Uncharacterized protein LW94_3921 [Fusarium fujikuroi]|nr:Uncharacterized protein LW94_3921 [Fusarium fujikuroi]
MTTRDSTRKAEEATAYSKFYHSLCSVQDILSSGNGSDLASKPMPAIPFESLLFGEAFNSLRSSAAKVKIASDPARYLVFKGVSFKEYLVLEPALYNCRRDGTYRELDVLCKKIPLGPHIMSPPEALVVIRSDDEDERVCGMLYPYYRNGSFAHALDRSVKLGIRIPLAKKAKWCYQIVSGIYHVHTNGQSWHQDLKPPNILLDDNEDIIIIDWEQGIGGTNTFTAAPETYHDVDAHYSEGEKSKVLYIPHGGPPRMNNIISTPHWDVFPTWSVHCRKAVELAEVYSLGATMFLTLEQVALEYVPGIEDYSRTSLVWSIASRDIPQPWKDVVDACVRQDPNERISMKELLLFWDSERHKLD